MFLGCLGVEEVSLISVNKKLLSNLVIMSDHQFYSFVCQNLFILVQKNHVGICIQA